MLSYVKLLRPLNGLMSVIAVWIGALLAGADIIPGMKIIYGFVAVFLVSGAGMVVNDIFDINIDKHNRPNRPLPSGKIGVGSAKAYAAALFIIGNFFGLLLGRSEFYVTLIASALLIAYAWKLKKVLVAGHIAISFMVALCFFFGSLIAGDLLAPLWLGVIAFLANMGREIYKTIDDMLGDKQAGVDSIALRLGVLRTKTIAASITVVAVLLSFAPYLLGQMKELYLFFVILADIAFISAVGAPVKYSSKLCKIGMIVALLAFAIGTPQILAIIH